ncbi:hypothetical protein KL906_003810 [Ogataea polymorpha]|nr:hypothetical protein KL906_003810 [Ogataea polymorpha]KAG7932771.1 hypothetical protein KL934_003426 [Ogataea polymorpha]
MGELDLGDIIQVERRRDHEILDSMYATPQQSATHGISDDEDPAREDLREVRLQDFEHQRRFERFLALCGVRSKVINRTNGSSTRGSVTGNSERYNLFPDSSDMSDGYDDDRFDTDLEDNALQPLVVTESSLQDQDLFYTENQLSFPPQDGDYEADTLLDRKIRSSGESNTIYISENYYEHAMIGGYEFVSQDACRHPCPINSNDTFKNFENHHSDGEIEIIQDFAKLDSLEFPLRSQPAQKFKDSLDIEFHGFTKLDFGRPDKYKNNIVCCSARHDLLFVAVGACVYGFTHKKDKFQPDKLPRLLFYTHPSVTTEAHRQSATRPHFPHTINYMVIGQLKEQETLGLCCDDGRVLLYNVERLVKSCQDKGIPNMGETPDYQFSALSSVWGLDMYQNMVVVSDNSQSIQLHYIDECGNDFHVQTHQILHNVPSVSFIKGEDEVYVSGASISGELVIFKFPMVLYEGPYNKENGDRFARVRFRRPYIISRALLGDNVWITRYVDSSCFKKVDSLELMTGDPWIDQQKMILNKMINESKVLDCESDECFSSHIGISASFHNFFIPTVTLDHLSLISQQKPFTSLSDNYRRIKKVYDDYYIWKQRSKQKSHISMNSKKYWEPQIRTPQFTDKFLVVSTALRMGLFRVNKLICNATVPKVFQFKPFNEDWLHSNRLSLGFLIPELNCYVVGSQSGLVSVFRLTTFRGIYGMRQEYVVPNYERLCLSGDFGVRTLIGIDCRRIAQGRYVLYLVYIDGICLSYQLSDRSIGFYDDIWIK